MSVRTVSILLAVALVPTLGAQVTKLKPGQYELVSEIALPGRSTPLPGRKDTHCYSAKDIEDLAKALSGESKSQTCKVLSTKTTGTVLGYTTECTHPDGTVVNSSIELEITSAESFHAVVRMKDTSGRSASPLFLNSTITMTGKRIGDCSK